MKDRTRASIGHRLAAYSLAAGVAAGLTASARGFTRVFDGPWFDSCPHFGGGFYDMILLKLDGTVLVDDANIDPAAPHGDPIEFVHNGSFVWEDGKDRDTLSVTTHGSAGVVQDPELWGASKLDEDDIVGPSSDWVIGELGLYGYGWFVNAGPWSGGGSGYLGMYIDDEDGRHYGWAYLTVGNARNEITLQQFAFETTPGVPVQAGGSSEPRLGDMDGDGRVDADDIDLLCELLGYPGYDLDGDNDTDEDDVTYLIEHLVELTDGSGRTGTKRGDFNLDGVIDATDLALMDASFQLTGAGYAEGNANCDDIINATDLAILHANYGYIAPAGPGQGASVPEPATLSILALGATGLTAMRRRRGL